MPSDLTISSFSDREILHILNDLAGHDGWVNLDHLADRVGLTGEGTDEDRLKHTRRCLGVRLGWIRRLTMTVERGEKGDWRLTVAGEEVVKAKVPDTLATRLDEMGEFSTLVAISHLSRRYIRAQAASANLMRREWVYGTHAKRR